MIVAIIVENTVIRNSLHIFLYCLSLFLFICRDTYLSIQIIDTFICLRQMESRRTDAHNTRELMEKWDIAEQELQPCTLDIMID